MLTAWSCSWKSFSPHAVPPASHSLLWFVVGRPSRTIGYWLQAFPMSQNEHCWWRNSPRARLPSLHPVVRPGPKRQEKLNCQVPMAYIAKPRKHGFCKREERCNHFWSQTICQEPDFLGQLSTHLLSCSFLDLFIWVCMLYQVFSFPMRGTQPQMIMGLSSAVDDDHGRKIQRLNDKN